MPHKDILIIGTDIEFCRSLQESMEASGLKADYIAVLPKALEMFVKCEYSLLIIDVRPAEITDILSLLEMLRRLKTLPILVLSERAPAEIKQAFFQTDANAYVEKPVDMEMCAAQDSTVIKLGAGIAVYPQYHQVLIDGEPLALTRAEFNILHLFACSPRQVFSLGQIYDHIYGSEFAVNGDEAARAHIIRLRKKLTAVGKNCIQNVRGVGYRLIPPDSE